MALHCISLQNFMMLFKMSDRLRAIGLSTRSQSDCIRTVVYIANCTVHAVQQQQQQQQRPRPRLIADRRLYVASCQAAYERQLFFMC